MQNWYKISSCKFEANVRMFKSLGPQIKFNQGGHQQGVQGRVAPVLLFQQHFFEN